MTAEQGDALTRDAGHKVTPAGVLVLPCWWPRAGWLEARRQGITATDVVALAGLHPYANAHDVWREKRAPVADTEPGEAARWGAILEGPVASEWARRNSARVRRVGLLRHHQQPHHLATCDRLVSGRRRGAVLEVKTRSAFAADEWEDGVPDRVAAQVQWQLHVTGLDLGHVAALIGGQRFAAFELPRDQVVIDYLVGLADAAWEAAQRDEPPILDPALLRQSSLDALHPDRGGATQVAPAEAARLVDDYRRAAREAAAAEAARRQAGLALQQALGDADTAMVGQQVAWTYRRTATTWRGTDLRRAAQVIPEAVAAGFLAEHAGSRRLHIPKDPKEQKTS